MASIDKSCAHYLALFGVAYFQPLAATMDAHEYPDLPDATKIHDINSFSLDAKNRDKTLKLPFTVNKDAQVELQAILQAYTEELSTFFLTAEPEDAFSDNPDAPLEQLAAHCDIYCEDPAFVPYLMKIGDAMRARALSIHPPALQYNSDSIDVFSGFIRAAFEAAAEATETEMPAAAMADPIVRTCAENFVLFLKYLSMRAVETAVFHHGSLNAGAVQAAIAGLNLIVGPPPPEFIALPARAVKLFRDNKAEIAKKIKEIKTLSAESAITQACSRKKATEDTPAPTPAKGAKGAKTGKTAKAAKAPAAELTAAIAV